MQDGRALDWAIIGAGVRPHDAVMRDRLLAGDLSQGMNCAEYAEIQDARLSQRLALEAGQ